MKTFVHQDWEAIFAANGLRTFEDFWRREGDWFERPNQRRGGWSGVLRLELERPEAAPAACFLKRQENHLTRTWRHPWRGIPTYLREFQMLQTFQRCGIPTLHPIYVAQERLPGSWRAVLVTEELRGCASLHALSQQWCQQNWPPRPERLKVIEAVANTARRMHAHRFRHGVLYAKHVFIPWPLHPEAKTPALVIDLEKARRVWSPWRAMVVDLDVLNRHSPGWSRTDRLRFLRTYLQTHRKDQIRAAWRAIRRRGQRRHDPGAAASSR